MNDFEADDERSSYDDDDIISLMDGIALNSVSSECNSTKDARCVTIRRRKIINAERNLLIRNHVSLASTESYNENYNNLRPLDRWKIAINKICKLKDPWKNFDIDGIDVERVERHQFDYSNDCWQDPVECLVKIEARPFNHGAMRECFRLKKMSSLFKQDCNWKHAGNYVAKKYLENVEKSVYYEDVKLQMDAKLWGQEYSRQLGIIKKVDICKMSLIKFVDRPNQPLYHLEHFMEGVYIKYNSNSGFVDENTRNTPQAFSHFTFERSGHKLIVVDIQGVGDLYTDPQIHTFSRTGYGDGNLGPRGMALFFYSHTCNSICQVLGLEKFDLCPSETTSKHVGSLCVTNVGTIAHSGEKVKPLCMDDENGRMIRNLNRRITHTSLDDDCQEYGRSTSSGSVSLLAEDGDDEASDSIYVVNGLCREAKASKYIRGGRGIIERNEGFFTQSMERKSSCAMVHSTGITSTKVGECILGEIHHEMARLHNCGKFVDGILERDINWEAFMFHEELAAKLGCLEAIRNLACFFLDMMSDSLFENFPLKAQEEDRGKGLEYMVMAAKAGNRRSMIFLGDYLAKRSPDQNLEQACSWYEMAVSSVSQLDDSGCFDSTNDTPIYEIMVRMADILSLNEKDTEKAYELYCRAAEDATCAGKGRLATKYFELSEEMLSRMEI